LKHSDRVYILAGGEIKGEGSVEEIADDEEIGRLYLGR
jgi:ABC-type lipopolysaccharide export system ATPase subunit